MNKTKKIIISLTLSLVILLIFNYILTLKSSSNFIKIPILNVDKYKGEMVSNKDISYIELKKTTQTEKINENIFKIQELEKYILNQNVAQGELLLNGLFVSIDEKLESTENYQYVCIPISSSSNVTCSKLNNESLVTIYYTGKIKDVDNVLKDKEKIYSSDSLDGLVTCKLIENVQVISKHNMTGSTNEESVITDIFVRLTKENVMLVTNLKALGTFDIVIN